MLSTALFVVQIALQAPGPPPPLPGQFRPPAPKEWVAFSADMEFTYPGRPTQYGRHVQDEHGCRRQESAGPDGTAMVTTLNFHTKTMYRLFRGSWSAQAMRVGQDRPVLASRLVDRKVEPMEDFDAYLARSTVRSPKGDYIIESVLIPELNSFEAGGTRPNGEVFAARNIRVGPQDHDQFLPPAGALSSAQAHGWGGFPFSPSDLRIVGSPREATDRQPVRRDSVRGPIVITGAY